MIANGLTKALPGQRFRSFSRIIGLVDIQARLDARKRLEALQEELRGKRAEEESATSADY
jgi:hypothetical protein